MTKKHSLEWMIASGTGISVRTGIIGIHHQGRRCGMYVHKAMGQTIREHGEAASGKA